MYDIIAGEIEKFEQDEAEGLSTTRSNNYLRASHYEDEFTGQEIEFMQARVQEAIEDYLQMNEIESFKVYSDWCVHVVDKNLHEELVNDIRSAIIEVGEDDTKASDSNSTLEHAPETYGANFTPEQVQEFEEADREDKKLIQETYASIKELHLKEVKDDLKHALDIGSIVFEIPEDKKTINLLLELIEQELQNN